MDYKPLFPSSPTRPAGPEFNSLQNRFNVCVSLSTSENYPLTSPGPSPELHPPNSAPHRSLHANPPIPPPHPKALFHRPSHCSPPLPHHRYYSHHPQRHSQPVPERRRPQEVHRAATRPGREFLWPRKREDRSHVPRGQEQPPTRGLRTQVRNGGRFPAKDDGRAERSCDAGFWMYVLPPLPRPRFTEPEC